MSTTETWREAFNAWWRSRPVCRAVKSPRGFAQMVWQAAFKAADVTVTTDEAGNAVAVTRTDEDGRILSVIWERPAASSLDVAHPFAATGVVDHIRPNVSGNAAARPSA